MSLLFLLLIAGIIVIVSFFRSGDSQQVDNYLIYLDMMKDFIKDNKNQKKDKKKDLL